eukprot:1558038-Lingulodinium_polyedra.AAC.1
MATPWNQGFVGNLCTLKVKNKFEVLALDESEYPETEEAIRNANQKKKKLTVDPRDETEMRREIKELLADNEIPWRKPKPEKRSRNTK